MSTEAIVAIVTEAKAACNLDPNCQAVYYKDWYESANDIHLCRMGTSYEDSSASCFYEKGKIWYFLAKRGIQQN